MSIRSSVSLSVQTQQNEGLQKPRHGVTHRRTGPTQERMHRTHLHLFSFFFFTAYDKDPVYQLNFFKPKLNITYLNNCQNLLSCQHSCTTGKHPQCTLNQKCITINVLISSLLNTEKTEIILWKSHPGNVNFTAGWDYSAHVSNTMEKQSVLVLVYERVTATLDYV